MPDVFRRLLPNHGHLRAKLDSAGRLQARQVSAVTNIAGTVAFVAVSRQCRDSGHKNQAPQRQECRELPVDRHYLHFSRVFIVAGSVYPF